MRTLLKSTQIVYLSVNPKIFSMLSDGNTPQIMLTSLSIQRQKQRHVDVHIHPVSRLAVESNRTIVLFRLVDEVVFDVGEVFIAVSKRSRIVKGIHLWEKNEK